VKPKILGVQGSREILEIPRNPRGDGSNNDTWSDPPRRSGSMNQMEEGGIGPVASPHATRALLP